MGIRFEQTVHRKRKANYLKYMKSCSILFIIGDIQGETISHFYQTGKNLNI